MLTFKQILRYTTADRIAKAGTQVEVGRMKMGPTKLGYGLAAAQVWSVEKGKKNKYVTSIQFHPKAKVKVSCSCSDFLYRYEEVLHRYGSADILHSNGEPADTTNPPPSSPGCCKHIVALHNKLVEMNAIPDAPPKRK